MASDDLGKDNSLDQPEPTTSPSSPVASAGDVTRILSAIEQGDSHAAEELLPLVYEELRRLAAHKMAQEKPGQTLQPTALVHEAYLRLVRQDQPTPWNGRGHFYVAAAEAMRRILVERARRRKRLKRGGQLQRRGLEAVEPAVDGIRTDVLDVDAAIQKLAGMHPTKAELVRLRYFGGLTLAEAASVLGVSGATADRHWRYARAWLARELRSGRTTLRLK
jgi:RNA polymerase sigma factor (TIGR02999 family)